MIDFDKCIKYTNRQFHHLDKAVKMLSPIWDRSLVAKIISYQAGYTDLIIPISPLKYIIVYDIYDRGHHDMIYETIGVVNVDNLVCFSPSGINEQNFSKCSNFNSSFSSCKNDEIHLIYDYICQFNNIDGGFAGKEPYNKFIRCNTCKKFYKQSTSICN